MTPEVLSLFPEGSQGVEMSFNLEDLPEELQDQIGSLQLQGVAIADDDGNLSPARGIIFEFTSHDEWKIFQKQRKIFVLFPFGNPSPMFLEAFKVERDSTVFQSTTVTNDNN